MPPQLSPDEAIAQLRKLPEDKQRLALSRLSPDVRKGILAQLTAAPAKAPSAVPPPPQSSAVDQPVTAQELKEHPVAGHVANFGAGAISTLRNAAEHPIDTFITGPTKALSDLLPAYQMVNGVPIPVPNRQGMENEKEQAKAIAENPLYTAGQVVGGVEAAEGAGKFMGPASRALKATQESIRTSAQSLVGAGERPVKAAVAKEAEAAQTEAENTRAANKKSDEETLKARGKVDTENKEAREVAAKTTREQEAAHKEATAKAKAGNEQVLKERKQRATAQSKLDEASSEMRGRIEMAREKALKVGNAKYNAVNEKLNSLPADNESILSSYKDAVEKIKGTQSPLPKYVEEIGEKASDTPLTYKDLQGYYSELGAELSKGTLPGDVFSAYDTLHEAIGEDMQRIANSQGEPLDTEKVPKDDEGNPVYKTTFGKALYDARAYWRRMKQTFGKPWNQNDNATAALKTANPDFLKSDEYKNRIRLLGSYDPEIPKAAEGVANLRQGLDALGKEKPLRQEVKSLPEKPTPAKADVKPYAEPKGAKPIERREVSTRAIREKLLDRWTTGESSLNKWQVRALLSGGLGSIVGLAMGGSEGIEAAGAVSAASYAFGPAVVAKLLDNPGVREWLTRPPTGELDALQKLPNADRIKITDGLKKVVQQAQTTGVPVSPSVLAFVGASAFMSPRTRQLQEMRQANQ
jgi:hypothetical protein